MGEDERKVVLTDAGITPKTPDTGSTLALKADLHMPWNQLRKLKVWLKEYGLHLESECIMRRQLQDLMPFHIVAENVPFSLLSGSIGLRPMVSIPDLVGMVHHYLDGFQATNQLFWHDGAISDSEIWLKIRGDHGGNSFKMSLQIVNVKHPNAVRNVIPFVVFEGKDTPVNLSTALQPFVTEIEKLRQTTWEGRQIRLMLFGDYELQTTLYGLSGSSGAHPCLHCTITRTDMQLGGATAAVRTLASMQADHAAFVSSGARLVNAKKFNNCIRLPVLPMELENVIIPVLHLDLGIFPWIFSALTNDCQTLDCELAAAGTAAGTDSESFTAAVAKHTELNRKRSNLEMEEAVSNNLQHQLEWLAVHAHNFTREQVEGATQAIQLQSQANAAAITKLRTDIQELSCQLNAQSSIQGP